MLHAWVPRCNAVRPRCGLGYLTPDQFYRAVARATVRTPDDARFWQDVADLLRQCAESTHLYLKLVGE